MILLAALQIVVAVWVIVAFLFGNGAYAETRKMLLRARAQRASVTRWPAVAILRPCAGLDPELEENLLSTVTARYDGPRELFILVATTADPAHAIAEAVRARAATLAPEIPVRVVVTAIVTQHNRKVAQLACAEGMSQAPIVAVIDSDLRLDDETLFGLVAALEGDPRAGASSCPSLEIQPRTLGDHASAAVLSSTPHAFYCLAALAERSGGAHVLCGALIAIRRSVLTELGGFVTLERYLGEDFELARQLHARGYTIPTAIAPGRITDHGRSLPTVLQRYARWATVTRQQRPHLMITYPLLLACTPLLLVTAAIALATRNPFALPLVAVIAITATVRVGLAVRLRRAYGLDDGLLRSIGAMLLGEVTIIAAFAGALGRPIVAWRGVRYRVGRGGLVEVLPPT